MPVQLPPKENSVFKRILRSYEQKQYKNGLKFCKQILSNPKYADHGETLAMKGLTLNCLGRKEEAYDYVRRGLRNDLKSHVCWHVFGLLQRSDRKYDEAIKCYRNALKWDKNNIQILRDLSLLQIQMRDLEGFRETRYCLLKQRPSQRLSWIGYSVSHYLVGEYEMAYDILEEFRKEEFKKMQYDESSAESFKYEHSEMLLYQNMILQEWGRVKESLDHLDQHQNHIKDKRQMKETQAKLQLQLGNPQIARELYKELVRRNPENWTYYKHLIGCIKPVSEEEHLAVLAEFRDMFPRAEAPRRLALDYATGNTFRGLVNDYLRVAIRKGVPPLFINLQPLYNSKQKVETIEDLFLTYIKNLEAHNAFDDDEEKQQEDPTVLLWTYFYAAQHFDHLKKCDLALQYIDKVLDHTPTLVEGYMVKGKIFKHAGCLSAAAKWMDEGRMLDTADRYVNSKCAKYYLRTSNIKKAEELCSLFERNEDSITQDSLHEMQCMWFEVECGHAFKRLGKLGHALKQCHRIDKHFVEIHEDQFDFHTYCMRKVRLCSYVRLLRLEDVLRNHGFYFKAAKLAIECYLELYDKPYDQNAEKNLQNNGNMTAADIKKLRSKQRRAEKKALGMDDGDSTAATSKKKQGGENKENKDSDKKDEKKKDQFDPALLVATDTPLEEAIKFLKPLQELVRDNIEVHFFAFEIYFRKGKPLLMLQAIKRAHAIDSSHPLLHECIVRFLYFVGKLSGDFDPIVRTVIEKEIVPISGGKSARVFNADYLQEHSSSLQHRLSAFKMLHYIDQSKSVTTLASITELSDNLTGISLESCSAILKLLEDGYFGTGSTSVAVDYKKTCGERFPLSDVFKDGDAITPNGAASELPPEETQEELDHQMDPDVN